MSDDRDIILHHVDSWEDLLKMGDPLAEVPTFATAENPLEMYVTVAAMIKALEDSIYSINVNRPTMDKTPERKAETDALLVQREAALLWLRQTTREHIFLSIHPLAEWGFGSRESEEEEDDKA